MLEAAVPTGTFGVYTSYIVNQKPPLWKVYPHKWDGKLTFSVPGGGASCSATVISGNNIVTAAHCIYDTTNNQFYSNWVYTPAYRNGAAPYGIFTAQTCWVLTAWVNLSGSFSINSWTRHDVAVCKLNQNSAGKTINAAVGWAGRLWNASYTQLVFNSGYPAQATGSRPSPPVPPNTCARARPRVSSRRPIPSAAAATGVPASAAAHGSSAISRSSWRAR